MQIFFNLLSYYRCMDLFFYTTLKKSRRGIDIDEEMGLFLLPLGLQRQQEGRRCENLRRFDEELEAVFVLYLGMA